MSAAIGTLVLSGSLLVGAAPASAALAPSCVYLSQWQTTSWYGAITSHARATNHCSTTKRFRMIWAWASDGDCRSVAAGLGYSETRGGWPPKVTELRSC
ncbi:hypothetical protein [Tersicoccus sp. Bi-70]|uniref:hypothetical protein n=1 Tax=Tersicoccus sp. Bi-70 TaxID=1897634 RepID=UPI00097871B4|nr:hypothetical protein [Tersicoccus sp. Bi-70]